MSDNIFLPSFKYRVVAWHIWKKPYLPGYYRYHEYEANLQYRLRPGDWIYWAIYEGRGGWFRGNVLDVSKTGFVLQNHSHPSESIELPFNHEPEEGYFCEPEERKLLIYPMPPFNDKPDFSQLDALINMPMPFRKHPYDHDYIQLKDYLPNLHNIQVTQRSLF